MRHLRGRAVGARQDQAPTGLPRLRFDPRWLVPPSKCPGSSSRTLWTEVENGFNVGQCLACGDYVTIRCVGKGYDAWGSGPVIHPPGKALFEPCPFHAWQRAALVDDVVRCGCGWPPGGPQ